MSHGIVYISTWFFMNPGTTIIRKEKYTFKICFSRIKLKTLAIQMFITVIFRPETMK